MLGECWVSTKVLGRGFKGTYSMDTRLSIVGQEPKPPGYKIDIYVGYILA